MNFNNNYFDRFKLLLYISIIFAVFISFADARGASEDDLDVIYAYCEIDTIETNGESPWCQKYRFDFDLEYCYCMKHDPVYSWVFPWEE